MGKLGQCSFRGDVKPRDRPGVHQHLGKSDTMPRTQRPSMPEKSKQQEQATPTTNNQHLGKSDTMPRTQRPSIPLKKSKKQEEQATLPVS